MVLAGSIRHADVLLCTGAVSRQAAPRVKRIYEQMPKPAIVVAVGACACSQGIFKGSYNMPQPLDELIPVDVYIPGCPPKPEAIIAGAVKVIEKVKKSVCK